jgi:dTDP-glucose pyrophosphorylase
LKAVVLSRGLGTRMKAEDRATALGADQAAAARTGVKALVPIGGRPFLEYVLSGLADAGCSEICLVTGPEHHELRDRYTKVARPRRFKVSFAIQEKPRGTADAVLAAEAFAGDQEFLMVNGDNCYPVSALRALVRLGRPGTALFTPEGLAARSNIEPARIAGFALAKVGEDGYLQGLVEKPDEAAVLAMGASRLVSMNCWRFPAAIFDACRGLAPSARGELEITDAVAALIARGHRFEALRSDEGVLDLSRRGDIPAVVDYLRDVVVDL